MATGYEKIDVGGAEDLTGQKFGHWIVLYRTHNDNTNKVMWVCQCDCEDKTTKPVSARTLKNHTSTNCGCVRKQHIAEKQDKLIHIRNEQGEITHKKCFRCKQFVPIENFWKSKSQKDGYCGECCDCYRQAKESRYNIYKKGAKKRKLDFELTKEQFYELTQQPCYYCGSFKNYNGIDRVDSSIGYIYENCVPCCEQCNKMKLDYSVEDWINHIKLIIKHMEEKQ